MEKKSKILFLIIIVLLFGIIISGGIISYKLYDEINAMKSELKELEYLKKNNEYLNTQVSNLQTSLDAYINSDGTENENVGYDISAFEQIEMSEIVSASKGKTIVVWLGMQGCGFCQAYAPLLESVTKDFGIKAKYVDVSLLTQDDYNVLLAIKGVSGYEDFSSQFSGTPFTMILRDGKIVGGLDGYYEKAMIETEFIRVGLSK